MILSFKKATLLLLYFKQFFMLNLVSNTMGLNQIVFQIVRERLWVKSRVKFWEKSSRVKFQIKNLVSKLMLGIWHEIWHENFSLKIGHEMCWKSANEVIKPKKPESKIQKESQQYFWQLTTSQLPKIMLGLFLDFQAFLWIPTDQWSKVRSQQTHNQGLRQLLSIVFWDPRA